MRCVHWRVDGVFIEPPQHGRTQTVQAKGSKSVGKKAKGKAKLARAQAQQSGAGQTAERPTGQQSHDAHQRSSQRNRQAAKGRNATPGSLQHGQYVPHKERWPAKPQPGDPAYRGLRDALTGDALGDPNVNDGKPSPYWMRAALYDYTRAVLDREPIPTSIHRSQPETADGRRRQDDKYAQGAPQFSQAFTRYMRDVRPNSVRALQERRRRWFDNAYVVDALMRDPRVGEATVKGMLALFRDGATWDSAARAAGHGDDVGWLWRRLEHFERRLAYYFRGAGKHLTPTENATNAVTIEETLG